MSGLLTPSEIAIEKRDLSDWEFDDDKTLRRSVTCESFPAAIEFVRNIADLAETANHHPDIDIRWKTVNLALSTHSEGGLTSLDIKLAHQINALVP